MKIEGISITGFQSLITFKRIQLKHDKCKKRKLILWNHNECKLYVFL